MLHVSCATLANVANLTLMIEDQLLKRARMRALEDGTSVNAVVREFLGRYVGEQPGAAGLRDFVAAARASGAGSGPGGRTWRRDDLYSDRLRAR